MVLPGVAAFTRVCAYDRPGTMGDVNPDLDPQGPLFYPGRSDPVPQPRTTLDKVADLHALLRAADIRGPYVLVGHSAGGPVVPRYASMYPDEVVGMKSTLTCRHAVPAIPFCPASNGFGR